MYMWLIEIGFRWVWLGLDGGGGGGGDTDTHIYSSNCVGQWDLVEREGCGEVKQNWLSNHQSSTLGIKYFRLVILHCMFASRHGSHCSLVSL